jgi:hypothetical protein
MVMDVFFKFANFALFVLFIAYYLRKNIFKTLYAGIARNKAQEQESEQQRLLLSRTYEELQEQRSSQQALYERLSEKVKAWQAYAQHEREYQIIEQRVVRQTVHDRMDKQMQSLACYKLEEQLVPLAFTQAALDLQARYSSQVAGHEYNQKVLHFWSSSGA